MDRDMVFELESGAHEDNKMQIIEAKSKTVIFFKISPPLFYYTVAPFKCKYFCKLMGPILTAAEGFILGLGAKMFIIAGPVIVYGVSASVVYGLIYWITTLF